MLSRPSVFISPHHPRRLLLRSGLGLAASLSMVASGAGGCASDGPKAMTPQERADATPSQAEQFSTLGYRLDWRGFPTMLPGERVTTLEIFDDILAVQESAGVVSVLETRSGQTRWSDQVAGRLTKFVGIIRDGDKLLISSESEVFFYDLGSGALKTKQHLAQVVNTNPVKVNDILIYGCANGQVLGHLILNGFRAWGSAMTGSINTDPLLIDAAAGHVAICSITGELAILDGQTGLSQGRAKMFAGPGAAMASSDISVFVASADQSLYCFTASSASPIWRKRTEAPLTRKPVFNDGKLYCDMGPSATPKEGGVTCFEPGTGKPIWSNPGVSGEVIGLRNKRLIVWDGGTCSALDTATGATIASVKLQNISMIKTDQFVDGHLYAVTPNGIVSKLSPK